MRSLNKITKKEELLICNRAINIFGQGIQKIVALEEMGELTQAISKSIRDENHNVEEEIADVEIMLTQLRLIYNSDKVEKIKQEKLYKLREIVLG